MLDHIVVLHLVFQGTSVLFSIVAAPIYIPTNSVGGEPHFESCISQSLAVMETGSGSFPHKKKMLLVWSRANFWRREQPSSLEWSASTQLVGGGRLHLLMGIRVEPSGCAPQTHPTPVTVPSRCCPQHVLCVSHMAEPSSSLQSILDLHFLLMKGTSIFFCSQSPAER